MVTVVVAGVSVVVAMVTVVVAGVSVVAMVCRCRFQACGCTPSRDAEAALWTQWCLTESALWETGDGWLSMPLLTGRVCATLALVIKLECACSVCMCV